MVSEQQVMMYLIGDSKLHTRMGDDVELERLEIMT